MIIGIDASRANHEQKTGVEWYAWHIIQELKTLVPSTDRVILYSDEPLKGELAIFPPHFESRVLRWPPKRFWTQIRLSWEMFRRPPDVLFVPAHVLPFIHPKKTVITIHDVAGAYFPKAYTWFERFYSVWSTTFALRKNARVIVPTKHVQSDILRLTTQPKRAGQIIVIPHGVDLSFRVRRSEEEKKVIREKYHLPESFFLFTGRLEEKKNVASLVRAYNSFREEYPEQTEALVLVGKPGFGYEEVKKAMTASPYNKDIIELGWVSSVDLPTIFQTAKGFVFLSWYEGFGIPLLEAFASGTPVISSNKSCLPEVGGDACLFVDLTKPEIIPSVLHRLISDDTLRVDLITKGAKRARSYSWQKAAMQTLQVIQHSEQE